TAGAMIVRSKRECFLAATENLLYQTVEKYPSAALRSSFVIAAYGTVRLIPPDFARLASGYF
ncbi:MAG: hypothetical protein NTV89_12850, partial [Proteobacteria bacterium]|nr:hypothetical protein [Pseudomonadota bacterium]